MKYYCDKYKRRKKRVAWALFAIVGLFFAASFAYLFCVVNPVVIEATEQSIFSLSTSAVSDAVYDVLSEEEITYKDLVEITYDSNEDVKLITLQTVRLNLIARRFYQVAQEYLDRMGQDGVNVPLGMFTGLPFLSGVGPNVNLKLVSIGAMTSTFESKFVSAGYNQTNHSVFIRLYASVSLILPCYQKTIDSVTEMLVAESVIVGKIPPIYFGTGLNFTPN